MGAKDAIYILENAGLRVRINGKGVVTKQSMDAGSKVQRGQQIIIELI
jgi:cell division protein FtsI (penicillin-binding protein 3)